jgi:hypothetical protein
VGWVERRTPSGLRTAFFAMNMDWGAGSRFDDRFMIANAIFREEGILPPPAAADLE